MNQTAIEVRALSADLLPDFLAFFDGTAVADNPKWASCYCQCFYEDHSVVKWAERTAPRNRGGIARQLLDAACDGLRQQGLRFVEGNPRTDSTSAAENHYGPLSLYLSAGFSVHREDEDGSVYVRRAL